MLTKCLSKIRLIVINSLELRNLLDQLISHYHDPVQDILFKVKAAKQNLLIDEKIADIKSCRNSLNGIIEDLSMFIVYDGLFNPEKRDFGDIEKELRSKLDNEELQKLLKKLSGTIKV